jgi:hypothetical protein
MGQGTYLNGAWSPELEYRAGLPCLNGSFVGDSLPRGRAAAKRGREREAARVVTARRKRGKKRSSRRNSSGPHFRHFRATRVGDDDDDDDDDDFRRRASRGEVVGRKVAVPRGRRSTDCNVARNYVSAVSTADILPSSPAPPGSLACILPRPQPQEFEVSKGCRKGAALLFRSVSRARHLDCGFRFPPRAE